MKFLWFNTSTQPFNIIPGFAFADKVRIDHHDGSAVRGRELCAGCL